MLAWLAVLSNLFGDLPPLFFRPLAGSLAAVYGVTLRRLYDLDFEGEPFEITQETAVEQAALVIEQSSAFSADAAEFRAQLQEELSAAGETQGELFDDSGAEEREARRLARHVLRRLEHCGWFDYEYREARKGYVLNFRDYAARILHVLVQIEKQEQPLFEGLAQSIKASLGAEEVNENPGIALYNAQSATRDLVREIKILSRNIHRYADRALKEAKSSGELLELQLEIYQKKVVHSSYHRFKTSDNIFRYRAFILRQLATFENLPERFEAATNWAATSQALTTPAAGEQVQEWVEMIRNQLNSIHLLTEDLDRKNARYSATTLQRISYLLNQDHLIENKLVRLIDSLHWGSENGFETSPPDFAAHVIRLWDLNSLYLPAKQKAEMMVERIPASVVSAERRRQVLEQAKRKVESQYSRRRVIDLVQELLRHKSQLALTDLPLGNTEDFLRLIFISYHSLDRRSPFLIELPPNWREQSLEIAGYVIHEGELKWRVGNRDQINSYRRDDLTVEIDKGGLS